MPVHPRSLFHGRLLGPSNTLSATFDTLCPFSSPSRALLVELATADGASHTIFCCDANKRIMALSPKGDLIYESNHGLTRPVDLAYLDGVLFVADAVEQRVTAFNAVATCWDVLQIGGSDATEYFDGRLLNHPVALCACEVTHRLFVCDAKDARVLVFRVSADETDETNETESGESRRRRCTFEMTIGRPGTAAEEELDWPQGVAVSSDGTEVFVADSGRHRVVVFSSVDGAFLRTFGGQGPSPGQFRAPTGIGLGGGYVFVTEQGQGQVRVQAFRHRSESADGPPIVLHPPGRPGGALAHVSVSEDGRLLVCDTQRHCVYHIIPITARMRRMRVVARLIGALAAALHRARERLYAPGGLGYHAAATSFARGIHLQGGQHQGEGDDDPEAGPEVAPLGHSPPACNA